MATTESGFVCDEFKDQFMEFDSEAIGICASIMVNATKLNLLAIKLRMNWENNGIIPVNTKYEAVAGNAKLMRTLLTYLGQGLTKDKESSTYGMRILSDHFIYFNCYGDKKLNKAIKHLNLPHQTVLELQNGRTALFDFVHYTSTNVLDNMELVGKYIKYFLMYYLLIFLF